MCVPAGGGLFRAEIAGANGAARKSAMAAAASLIPSITGGVPADAVFLAGQLHGGNIAVGVCSLPQQSLLVCSSRDQMLAHAANHGPMSPVWCSLDTIAAGMGAAGDEESN